MNRFLKKLKTLQSAIKTYRSWPLWVLYRFGYRFRKETRFCVSKKCCFFFYDLELEPVDSVFRLQSYTKNLPLNSSDIVLDIGANIGLFALYASTFCGVKCVFCYEPNQSALLRLRKNIHSNNLDDKITVIPKAVTADGRDLKLFTHQLGTTMTTTTPLFPNALGEASNVSSDSFTRIVQMIKPTFVKIDIEGGEYEIFAKTPPETFLQIPRLVCEYHWQGYEQIKKTLGAAGFQVIVEETMPVSTKSGTLWTINRTT